MTDDISKVVARLESATTPAEVGDEILAWRFDYCGTHAMVWLNRPADAAMFANVTPLVDARYAATLARQLAEAKEDAGQREYDREILSSLERLLRRNQFGYTGRYDEVVAQMAAALASSNTELTNLRAANIAYASEVENLYGRAGLAESQLAEATRRLGEVEGAARRLRSDYVRMLETARDRIRDLGGECDPVDVMERADPALRAFDAALQKEPTA